MKLNLKNKKDLTGLFFSVKKNKMKKILTIISVTGMSVWFIMAFYVTIISLVTTLTASLKILNISFFVWIIPALILKAIEINKNKSVVQKEGDTKTKKSCSTCKKKSKNGNV